MSILVIIYVFFTTLGVTLLKLGGDSLSISFKPTLSFSINYYTFFGLISYVVSFILWQKIISTNNISTIFAITTAIVQVVLLIIGIVIFKENISTLNIVGIATILIGVFILIWK